MLFPLVFFTIALGVYPKPVFDITSASVAHLIAFHESALDAAALLEAAP
jgi:NADH-quinone oxidoreductase subunit M